jgi:hypothetical protein
VSLTAATARHRGDLYTENAVHVILLHSFAPICPRKLASCQLSVLRMLSYMRVRRRRHASLPPPVGAPASIPIMRRWRPGIIMFVGLR